MGQSIVVLTTAGEEELRRNSLPSGQLGGIGKN
jgi:hypothetical protein